MNPSQAMHLVHHPGETAEKDRQKPADAPYVSLADITEIELIILKRMREVAMGDHRSSSHGNGFDFLGLRDWEPGDRPSAIDWP